MKNKKILPFLSQVALFALNLLVVPVCGEDAGLPGLEELPGLPDLPDRPDLLDLTAPPDLLVLPELLGRLD